MSLWEVVGLAVALGADSFSVCVGLGLERVPPRRSLLLSFVLGVAQGSMLLAGYTVATTIHWLLDQEEVFSGFLGEWAGTVDPTVLHDEIHWVLTMVGAMVLGIVGLNLIFGFFRDGRPPGPGGAGIRGLMVIAFMVNVDAFSAGLGMGMLHDMYVPVAVGVMVVVGGALAALGLTLGQRLGKGVGRVAQPLGGVVLVAIALRAVAGAA